LNNTGKVNKEDFVKVIEKIGIIVFDKQDFYDLFDFYDSEKKGYLNYYEFASILFGN